jgi:hypothetical protein
MTDQKKRTDLPEEPDPSTGFRAWFRSWRYFIGLLVLMILVALFYTEENWRGKRAWANYRSQLEARGELFDASAFIPAPVPMSENFAMTPLLAPLFEFIPNTQRPRSTNAITTLREFAPAFDSAVRMVKATKSGSSNSWIAGATDLPAWYAAFLLGTNSPTAARIMQRDAVENFSASESAKGILAALSESDPVLQEIRDASHRRYSRFNISYNEEDPAGIVLPHLAALKHFCQVLQLRASAELALGRTDEAAADVDLMLYLTDATRDEPIMVSQLIRMEQLYCVLPPIAEGMRQWSEPQLRSFQERLLRFDFCADMKRALDSERVFLGAGIIDFLHRNPEKYQNLVGGANGADFPGVLWAAAPSGWFDFEKLNYSRVFEAYHSPGMDLSNHLIKPQAALEADAMVSRQATRPWPVLLFRHHVFCAFLLPGFSVALRKTAFAQTAADVAGIACALERYRRAQGQYPDSLESLTTPAQPVLLPRLPHDVIDAQPLKFRKTEDGRYLIYSIGWNQKDDGGVSVPGKGEDGRSIEGDWVWQPLPEKK